MRSLLQPTAVPTLCVTGMGPEIQVYLPPSIYTYVGCGGVVYESGLLDHYGSPTLVPSSQGPLKYTSVRDNQR